MKVLFSYILFCGCVGCAVVERASLDPLDSPIFVRGGIYRVVDEAWTEKELKAEPCEQCKRLFYVEASDEASVTREPNRDLLTRVKNTIYGSVASQYDYTNDLGGRRTQIAKSGTMMAQDEVQDYGYNTRDELISGQGLTYNYDDIGNRTTAEGKVYTANNLNQYTAIDTFEPQYDADGNQTLIKTSTGVWSVTYNAENRPVRWEQGDVVITMDFDRMGRRVFYKEEAKCQRG